MTTSGTTCKDTKVVLEHYESVLAYERHYGYDTSGTERVIERLKGQIKDEQEGNS